MIKDEHKLTGHLLQTFQFLEVNECESSCIQNEKCKSINTINATGITCELNSKSTADPRDNNLALTKSLGWTYRSTDYITKKVSEFLKQLNYFFLKLTYNFCVGSTLIWIHYDVRFGEMLTALVKRWTSSTRALNREIAYLLCKILSIILSDRSFV